MLPVVRRYADDHRLIAVIPGRIKGKFSLFSCFQMQEVISRVILIEYSTGSSLDSFVASVYTSHGTSRALIRRRVNVDQIWMNSI